ncbi:MAG: glycerophosphodiester phosphodiesterase family protein [Litorimonas sp.]
MTHTPVFKAPISIAVTGLLLAAGLSSCKAAPGPTPQPTQTAQVKSKLAPIRKALSCLPAEAAIIAAHRGTDERWADQAENSIGGLNALIAHGTIMAEIDVAGLKDDTLITFHDGVWDEISTGKGPIAVSTKADLESILLKSRSGDLTADRPPLFADMLNAAKGKMYMEVDFKSSADPTAVIKAVRDADMTDQVLLIAYNPDQAALFERLAPDMLRSNPTKATQKDHGVWLGYGVGNENTAKTLKSKGNYIIGRIGDPNRQPPLNTLIQPADILVTDEAERYEGIVGLTNQSRVAYEACLTE